MRALKPWISSWAVPELCSGMAGVGASGAWYGFALRVEKAIRSATEVAMTAIDLYKCYDQINRWVLYIALARSGCPVDVLTGYMTHVEGLE
eukprot:560562-Alexandrium_andersonii.AAC.1